MSKKVNGVVCCLLFLISSLCFGAEPRQLATEQEKARIRSHIQDVFNEFNVQIMSPNFVLQPENAVMVSQDHWYTAPAVQPDKPS
ncbi:MULTISPECIES: hypothetical protein [Serratia]|uniref:hypothetical protein n=1 Tax=Serratia TaxID=613 RepID=UPI002169E80A|nr:MULTISPECIES: hypothetical protein [Serratia]MCS4265658.1 hypothetical protein [Serratia sp. BIGb0163]